MSLAQGKLQKFILGESLKGQFVSLCLVRGVENSGDLLKILMDKDCPQLGRLAKDRSVQSVIVMNARMVGWYPEGII